MPFPYLLRAGEVVRLPVAGVPLGLFEESSYDDFPFRIEKGDLLVLASDGATDAGDPEGRMFDAPRFIESIRRHADEDAAQLTKSLYGAICEFTRAAEVQDDITILALKRSA
jgi:sigma-B regulation protein RsbU (phosphoserine phosphatase)